MKQRLSKISGLSEKLTSLGALTAAMGCAMCFPAIASLGGALGLGFLAQWEWMFINTLLPLLAVLSFILHLLRGIYFQLWKRSLFGMLGPVILLLSLYPWFQYGWSAWATYFGLALMVLISLWDLLLPINKQC